MTPHIALLGDSIFDNHVYTGGQPDVVTHLRDLLPSPWAATLCAVDGATTSDFGKQLKRVPAHVTHVVLSLGGNDALMNADLLNLPVRSTAEALDRFGERMETFERSYGWALEAVLALGRKTTVCTIYNGNLGANEAPRARLALMMFNDVIVRAALQHSVDIIDLRLVCTQPGDYANPIEPSGPGGRKIAAAIAATLGAVGTPRHKSTATG